MIILFIAGILAVYGAVCFKYVPYNKWDYYNYGDK